MKKLDNTICIMLLILDLVLLISTLYQKIFLHNSDSFHTVFYLVALIFLMIINLIKNNHQTKNKTNLKENENKNFNTLYACTIAFWSMFMVTFLSPLIKVLNINFDSSTLLLYTVIIGSISYTITYGYLLIKKKQG